MLTRATAVPGNRMGVLLPLEVKGERHEYTFWFEVKDPIAEPAPSAIKTAGIGSSPTSTNESQVAQSAKAATVPVKPWIASFEGGYFYWHECPKAKEIPESKRLEYATRADAERSGRAIAPESECQGPQS